MVTGLNRCPICKKWYNPKKESKLKIKSIQNINGKWIYDFVCLDCYHSIIKIENLKDIVIKKRW